MGTGRPAVVAVGLGPAGPELLTEAAARAISGAGRGSLFLRTGRHPSATVALAAGAVTFDHVYEEEPDFDSVYRRIVDDLVAAAERSPGGRVVYAVPGSPRVAETTVARLEHDPRVDLLSVPGLSFLDLVWDRLGVDPIASGPRMVDGPGFSVEAAGERGPLVVAQCWSREVLSGVKLALPDREGPAPKVVVLHHLGLADEVVQEIDWPELDHFRAPDHLTSLWIPELAEPVGAELARLAELVRVLRERCPWDRAQTHASLTRHLIEEAYEVVEAIEELDGPDGVPTAQGYQHLEEELGDLLFQVYFHATLGAEAGQFGLAHVARGIHDKLVGRHPHVFGDVRADTPAAVAANWEVIKAAEKGRQSAMDGLTGTLPALSHAHNAQRKAAAAGFDWPSVEGPMDKVVEELGEVRAELASHPSGLGTPAPPAQVAHEVGDLLFAAVNVARHAGVDPETALRASTREFVRRFREVERTAREEGLELASASPSILDRLWEAAKAADPSGQQAAKAADPSGQQAAKAADPSGQQAAKAADPSGQQAAKAAQAPSSVHRG